MGVLRQVKLVDKRNEGPKTHQISRKNLCQSPDRSTKNDKNSKTGQIDRQKKG